MIKEQTASSNDLWFTWIGSGHYCDDGDRFCCNYIRNHSWLFWKHGKSSFMTIQYGLYIQSCLHAFNLECFIDPE